MWLILGPKEPVNLKIRENFVHIDKNIFMSAKKKIEIHYDNVPIHVFMYKTAID